MATSLPAVLPVAGCGSIPHWEYGNDSDCKEIQVISIGLVNTGAVWAGTTNGLYHRSIAGVWSGPLFADENVNSIFIHGADTILVGLSYVDPVPYLVVRSTDAGLHWLDLDFNFDDASFNVYNIYALEETAQGLVIAGTDSGLYVFQSSDSTWQSFGGTNVPDSIIVNSFTPLANGIIMGTYGSGVYRYSYTGSSWQQIGMPAVVNTLATYGNGNVFAGINGGVYNSSDLGATWESGGLLGTTRIGARNILHRRVVCGNGCFRWRIVGIAG